MATQVQWRGGSTAEHATFTGAAREVTVDTQKQTLVLHDGSTAGGRPLLREDGSNAALALGSAGTPSLKFTGDLNTGIYSPGADQLAISTNGTGRLFVDASGRVGAGNSSPGSYNASADDLVVGSSGDTGISIVSGTSSQGSIFFADGTTGGAQQAAGYIIYPHSGDYMAFGTTNTERLRITSTGLLGLGTSSPAELLHVSGGNIRLTGTAGVAQTAFREINFNNLSTTANPGVKIVATTGSNTSDHELAFYTTTDNAVNTTEKVRISHNGSVGIGTTSPGSTLQVQDAAGFIQASGAGISFNRTSGTANYINTGQASGLLSINAADAITFGTSTTGTPAPERARIDSSGRLLVGTSSTRSNLFNGNTAVPAYTLIEGANDNSKRISTLIYGTTSSSAGPILALAAHNSNTVGGITAVTNGWEVGRISFQGADGTNFVEAGKISCEVDGTPGAGDMPGRIVLSTTSDGASSPTERMRLDSLGNLLIGKTVTDFGTAGARCTNDGILQLTRDSDTQLATNRLTNDGTAVAFSRSTTQVGTISVTTTATAYNTSSDYRLKENVVPLTGAIDRVNQLQVHRFNFIADPGKTVDGFIAHEAQTVVPECATGAKDELDADGNPVMQGIDQSKLVPLLTAALQEAIAKIETLEARLTAAGIA
jgi:hypothetical protein